MFYYIANHSVSHFAKDDIVAKFDEIVVNEFLSNGHVTIVEYPNYPFPKVIFKEYEPEKYIKDGVTTLDAPMVRDDSWSYCLSVEEIPGKPYVPAMWVNDEGMTSEFKPNIPDTTWEFRENAGGWVKGSEIVFQQPLIEDNSYTYREAIPEVKPIPAVPEYWIKNGIKSYEMPMTLDDSYEVVPEVKPHYVIVNDELKQAEYDKKVSDIAQLNLGKNVRMCCNEIMDCVIGYNLSNLSTDEITQQSIDYAPIYKEIQGFRPNKAKPLIENLSTFLPLKSQLLDILLKYGF